MKYSSYLDLHIGDKIKFTDGSVKTITKVINSHRVIFDDGKTIDLSVVEDRVDEVIQDSVIGHLRELEKPQPVNKNPQQTAVDEMLDCVKPKVTKKKISIPKEVTYDELFKIMESADLSEYQWSRYFWQYTHANNLAKIAKSGYFKSRYNLMQEGDIPFDIAKHVNDEKISLAANRSNLTIRHVRFYLRLMNAPYFDAFNNIPEENKKCFVIVAINKDALRYSNNSTFLFPLSGIQAKDEVFNKTKQLNLKGTNKFTVYKYNDFDFGITYSDYLPENDYLTKKYQEAEFLVWKDLSIKYIEKIYFFTIYGRDLFLSQIRYSPAYNLLKGKCFIYSGIFGYKNDKYNR